MLGSPCHFLSVPHTLEPIPSDLPTTFGTAGLHMLVLATKDLVPSRMPFQPCSRDSGRRGEAITQHAG